MQNLVGHGGGGGGAPSVSGTGGSDDPQPLSEHESPERDQGGEDGAQCAITDSGRNSFTSLPTYTAPSSSYAPAPSYGPFSASTNHINRLGTDKLTDKSNYQNGLNVSDSGRSSSGKSSSSYHRLCNLVDMPPAIHASPSSDDIIQDLEDRLWEKEQEVLTHSLDHHSHKG